ncbi:malto-oligosyltrehalose synthase [Actinomadura viridis]|uniref:(1->4)-alpha-D-glucan 1-alpha-D-glucosylmutase n=1 Tax=Actinomadura viridis TaxID=58110 RepID=A0A931GNQ2_9ACTN|nr:malto-oligosyltrehalose synthase [Actinomadura viridis]MBG6086629.1 (1->4)-alpha-D-glucan 1-alpha-D-glucosylmutase [Actinomadura viridis]
MSDAALPDVVLPDAAASDGALPGAPATGTYRIQLRGTDGPGHFGFAEAAALAPYLESLGVSHVYLSPILQAAPGSTHGYDVIDHDRLSAELGGPDAFRAMVERFRAHGLRVLVDVVPNHMAVPDPPELNRALASVIEQGPRSPYARWFDVDWEAGGGRIVLPGQGEPNYRRFFDISGLICLRQEDPEVFARTHALTLRLVDEGLIDGLRIDHPDGLADPGGYLDRLSDAASAPGRPRWILVEKITTGAERLPAGWRCAGTTGYDALGMVGGVFVDPDGEEPLTGAYVAFTGGPATFAEVEHEARRYAAEHGLRPELDRLHGILCRALGAAGDPGRREDLRTALVELLAAMPVYRAYVVPGEPASPDAARLLEETARHARDRLPRRLHGELDAIVALALGGAPGDAHGTGAAGGPAGGPADAEAAADFVVRFQQTSAPLAAKGVEDTAFYRWSRMAALNEVGGDPARFAVEPAAFHDYSAALAREWPATMTTLSTHDTKRQEDVRARLAVLAELPGPWASAVGRWHGWDPEGSPMEPDLEYLFWQTLVGAWPITEDRLTEFLTKAMREAKTRSSWLDPDTAYEKEVLAYARRVLADADLVTDLAGFVAILEPYFRSNVLGQKLVQLTMPGVPDVYQGCELTGLALVDPDNRRPVDHGRRRARLAHLDGGGEPADPDDEKLLVTSRALRARRRRPDWFAGGYEPVPATGGSAARHALAFLRGDRDGGALTVATRLPVGLERAGGWGDAHLDLEGIAGPEETGAVGGAWRDLLTGAVHRGPRPRLARILRDHPVALLVPDATGDPLADDARGDGARGDDAR